jgi:hypothetical protein
MKSRSCHRRPKRSGGARLQLSSWFYCQPSRLTAKAIIVKRRRTDNVPNAAACDHARCELMMKAALSIVMIDHVAPDSSRQWVSARAATSLDSRTCRARGAAARFTVAAGQSAPARCHERKARTARRGEIIVTTATRAVEPLDERRGSVAFVNSNQARSHVRLSSTLEPRQIWHTIRRMIMRIMFGWHRVQRDGESKT